MAIVLIAGQPASGKTTMVRQLPAEHTAYLRLNETNLIGQRKWSGEKDKLYLKKNDEGKNIVIQTITGLKKELNHILTKEKERKYVILDAWTSITDSACRKKYVEEKFTEKELSFGQDAIRELEEIKKIISKMADDNKVIFFLILHTHTIEIDGKVKETYPVYKKWSMEGKGYEGCSNLIFNMIKGEDTFSISNEGGRLGRCETDVIEELGNRTIFKTEEFTKVLNKHFEVFGEEIFENTEDMLIKTENKNKD